MTPISQGDPNLLNMYSCYQRCDDTVPEASVNFEVALAACRDNCSRTYQATQQPAAAAPAQQPEVTPSSCNSFQQVLCAQQSRPRCTPTGPITFRCEPDTTHAPYCSWAKRVSCAVSGGCRETANGGECRTTAPDSTSDSDATPDAPAEAPIDTPPAETCLINGNTYANEQLLCDPNESNNTRWQCRNGEKRLYDFCGPGFRCSPALGGGANCILN